jgi:hypothetical protein
MFDFPLVIAERAQVPLASKRTVTVNDAIPVL